jgi:uncharacterized damage-inducible protein DinB
MEKPKLPEPWLRGTLTEVPPVQRAILHALDLAGEDLGFWCGELTDEELNVRPMEIAPVAFHIRHIARSLDRLLSYAEGNQLSLEQITAMKAEMQPGATSKELFEEWESALNASRERVLKFAERDFSDPRGIGRQQLPTSLGGILVHVADHTQRHVGQAIVTTKIVKGKVS